jgi:hypothetical protein
MTGPATGGGPDPADRRDTYEQHIEAAAGASVYAVLHGDIHIRNGWPVYRLEPFPVSPKPVSRDRAMRQPCPRSNPPRLADALVNLAATLAELGQLGEALEVAQEATAAWRPLARADPWAYAPNLSRALDNLSTFRALPPRPRPILD